MTDAEIFSMKCNTKNCENDAKFVLYWSTNSHICCSWCKEIVVAILIKLGIVVDYENL